MSTFTLGPRLWVATRRLKRTGRDQKGEKPHHASHLQRNPHHFLQSLSQLISTILMQDTNFPTRDAVPQRTTARPQIPGALTLHAKFSPRHFEKLPSRISAAQSLLESSFQVMWGVSEWQCEYLVAYGLVAEVNEKQQQHGEPLIENFPPKAHSPSQAILYHNSYPDPSRGTQKGVPDAVSKPCPSSDTLPSTSFNTSRLNSYSFAAAQNHVFLPS